MSTPTPSASIPTEPARAASPAAATSAVTSTATWTATSTAEASTVGSASARVDAQIRAIEQSGLTVHELTAADIPDFVALIASAYRGEGSKEGWTTEADLIGGQRLDAAMAADHLAEPDSTIFLLREAEDGAATAAENGTAPDGTGDRVEETTSAPELGPAIGSVYLRRPVDGVAYLGLLAVSPLGQGRGVGSALMALADAWVAERWGASSMRMTVINKREELIAYYERRGYVRTGETEPFPYGQPEFGVPKVDDLGFVHLVKKLS